LSIRQKAEVIGTYRFVSVFIMETLARWVPTTPEFEAKALLGRHIWDFAQHADHFGHRTTELRAGLHHTREPDTEYLEILKSVSSCEKTNDRLDAIYEIVLPHLGNEYEKYLATTDVLLDEPSVHIMQRILFDFERMTGQRDELLKDRPDLAPSDSDIVERIRKSINSADITAGIQDHSHGAAVEN